MTGYDGEERRATPSIYDLDKRLALVELSLQTLHAEVRAINSNINRVVWIAAAAILAAIVQFALKGGFH
jgi:hypothetical protein